MNTHYFFALTLPNELKEELYSRIGKLKVIFPFKKWLHPADYHITMAFLGDTSEAMREESLHLVRAALKNESVFDLTLNKVGTFGRVEQPRILWADVAFEQRLFDVQTKVYQACIDAGFTLDSKPFKPHITLARKYTGETPFDLEKAANLANLEHRRYQASQITLYQTHIGEMPSYEPLVSIKLE